MAKRRKLETPSAKDLSRIEEEFRSETSPRSGVAPIAQVAGDAASKADVLGVETRAKLAEADAFRDAQGRGLVLVEIPIDRIRADELVRDRAVIDRDELTELRASIVKNGLRLPIEVYELAEKTSEHDYGLISGYRRLMAYQEARKGTGVDKFEKIKAIVRKPESSAESVAAMVEENEIRANLTHFERGRIAALSAQSGTFVNVEEAVTKLFAFASKAKRSKIRSFALIFEELGDLLYFPEALSERQGLAIAAAIRAGAENSLRETLALATAETAAEEWAVLEPILARFEGKKKDPARGGRPTAKAAKSKAERIETSRGVTIAWEPIKKGGYNLRLTGKIASDDMDDILALIRDRLS
ncbi:ParB N-terminal domain-containing protein [Rhodobacteraceae bacterium]|nr:ParB N-terminal domain-containing protein [Paracoccaceae bacterium]